VGAGVAGALIAWRLALAGQEVIVLEAGPKVDRHRAVERFRTGIQRLPHSPYPQSELAPSPLLNDWESHFRQQGPELFMGIYQRLLGGTTWHWLGTALRLLPEDFRMKTEFGVGVDWPLTYDELEPWYGEAEKALGVAGDSTFDLGSYRSCGYPMPSLDQARADRVVNQAMEATDYQAIPLPQARNSLPYQGRPRCCGSASCIPICPIGAKYDATVHLKMALEAGADIHHNALVTRLVKGVEGRIARLDYLTVEGPKTVAADRFVIAAHAVESARLLQLSGLANSSDQVGRNLMGASAQMSWCLAPEPVYPYRAPQATSGFFHGRGGTGRVGRAGYLCTIATDGWPQFGPDQVASHFIRQGMKGEELRHAVRDHVSRQVALVSTCEQLPHPENRVTLAVEWPDSAGLPRPNVRYQTGDYTVRGVQKAREFHELVFQHLKGEEQQHALATDPAYLLGTTRMGRNPKASVVDGDLRSHDHSNLFLVGSGVFPTSGSAPPTLTVAALALRAAAHLTT
jgi:glucose dehydrogenase